MNEPTPQRKPQPEHPQRAVTLEAMQRPHAEGEAFVTGISGGMSVGLYASQWAWLRQQKERAYRQARKAVTPKIPERPYGGPRNLGDQESAWGRQ